VVQLKKKYFNYFLLVFCILIFLSKNSISQTPSHFILGEEELSGIDIYDIHQDQNNVFWLATNNGLIKYDGYKFENITCDEALSNSVFNLKTDYNNVLFGMNLSGQIFQIKDNICKVYFKVPESLMYKEMFYGFDNNNNLIIATKSLFKVAKDNSIIMISENTTFSDLIVLKDSTIQLFNPKTNQLMYFKNNSINQLSLKDKITEKYLHFFNYNDNYYTYNPDTRNIAIINDNRLIVDSSFAFIKAKSKEILRFYPNEKNLIIAKQSGGVLFYNCKYKRKEKPYFQNYLISSVCVDDAGNYLLGTFGRGILVIPNINLVDVKILEKDNNYTRITSLTDSSILLGTQKGSVYQVDYNQKVKLVWSQNSKNVEVLEYFPKNNSILIDGKQATLVNLKSKKEKEYYLGAIKDVAPYKNKTYLVACNSGVFNIKIFNSDENFEVVKNFDNRTYCIDYDSINNTIYAGTAFGLKIGNQNQVKIFTENGKAIICRDILYFKGKMFVTTKNNGLIVFKNNKVVDKWNIKKGFPTNNLNQIKEYNNHIYITSDKGLIVTTLKGDIVSVLNKSEGLQTNKIIDFEINNEVLWMIHQKGIQKINLNNIMAFKFVPNISIEEILVNDLIISDNPNTTFNYLQNKFEFHVSASTLKYQNEIIYQYQLIGIDNDWQTNKYSNNKIFYKSLPAGNYILKVKSICRGFESDTISFKFKISLPFWKKWWFYLLIALLLIIITFVVFKREVSKQKKKIELKNELNASKLIAIQSQMNPHFIFNAINSIQDLILKEDIDNSYSYIIKFSKLVRQTLNFSDKEFIDIEDEIELLEIYLELEKLRFKNDFEYSINCQVSDIQVPPMLAQPFVENAIKHGLLHKEGLKKLTITFNKNETLQCIIADNGIGREKAQEIKDRQQKKYKSFSVNATRTRFEIMQSHYQQNLGVQFEDLKANGEAQGTKVIINMPFIEKY